jgi:hypothetical protein
VDSVPRSRRDVLTPFAAENGMTDGGVRAPIPSAMTDGGLPGPIRVRYPSTDKTPSRILEVNIFFRGVCLFVTGLKKSESRG